MAELKAGINYEFGVILVDAEDRPTGTTGVTSSQVQFKFRRYGETTWNTGKSPTATNWIEVGDGVYIIAFEAAELSETGEFDFLVQDVKSTKSFDDYRGNIYLPKYHSQDIYDKITTETDEIDAALVLIHNHLHVIEDYVHNAYKMLKNKRILDLAQNPPRLTVYDDDAETPFLAFDVQDTETQRRFVPR